LRLRGEDWGRSGEGGKINCGWLREKKKKVRRGSCDGFFWVREKKRFCFLGFSFCVVSPNVQNYPLLFVSCGPIFLGKMLLEPQNWSLNFPFFVNFDFSCIF
jgi:hypothetical protein